MTKEEITKAIKEYKEYKKMEADLKNEEEILKKEITDYMEAEGVNELLTEEGKATYREVQSKRFATTEFKKLHGDLYEAFTTATSSMRFTCN